MSSHRKHRPLDLRSDSGKALLALTKEQFAYWEEQLREEATGDLVSSHAIHYWYILSTIALDGDQELKIEKSRIHEALPRASIETGRKYAAACQEHGLVRTIVEGQVRYVALTQRGERALSNTLGRWMVEFSRIRRTHLSKSPDRDVDDIDG